jgi:hypothetical protein
MDSCFEKFPFWNYMYFELMSRIEVFPFNGNTYESNQHDVATPGLPDGIFSNQKSQFG